MGLLQCCSAFARRTGDQTERCSLRVKGYLSGARSRKGDDARRGRILKAPQPSGDMQMRRQPFYSSPPGGTWRGISVDAVDGTCTMHRLVPVTVNEGSASRSPCPDKVSASLVTLRGLDIGCFDVLRHPGSRRQRSARILTVRRCSDAGSAFSPYFRTISQKIDDSFCDATADRSASAECKAL